jgi:hypothetical protein
MHNRLRTLAHPPYSPDMVPADFYLFRNVKNKSIGKFIQDKHELFLGVSGILNAFPTTELWDVFCNLIHTLKQVIDS